MGSTTIGTRRGRDLLAKQAMVVGAAVAASVGALAFDWCQRLCMLLVPYEAFEADEYVLVCLFLALGFLAAFALRERHLRFQLIGREQENCRALAAARTDYLTGLPNRLALAEYIATNGSARSEQITVLLIDLDGFKSVNDTFGHEAGDIVLQAVALRLAGLRDHDDELMAFRLGGDEFALIRAGIITRENLEALAASVLANISRPIAIGSDPIGICGSIGVASSDGTARDLGSVLSRADAAMFAAKRRRAGSYFACDGSSDTLRPSARPIEINQSA